MTTKKDIDQNERTSLGCMTQSERHQFEIELTRTILAGARIADTGEINGVTILYAVTFCTAAVAVLTARSMIESILFLLIMARVPVMGGATLNSNQISVGKLQVEVAGLTAQFKRTDLDNREVLRRLSVLEQDVAALKIKGL